MQKTKDVVPGGHEEICLEQQKDGTLAIMQKRADEEQEHAVLVGPVQKEWLISLMQEIGE